MMSVRMAVVDDGFLSCVSCYKGPVIFLSVAGYWWDLSVGHEKNGLTASVVLLTAYQNAENQRF